MVTAWASPTSCPRPEPTGGHGPRPSSVRRRWRRGTRARIRRACPQAGCRIRAEGFRRGGPGLLASARCPAWRGLAPPAHTSLSALSIGWLDRVQGITAPAQGFLAALPGGGSACPPECPCACSGAAIQSTGPFPALPSVPLQKLTEDPGFFRNRRMVPCSGRSSIPSSR